MCLFNFNIILYHYLSKLTKHSSLYFHWGGGGGGGKCPSRHFNGGGGANVLADISTGGQMSQPTFLLGGKCPPIHFWTGELCPGG